LQPKWWVISGGDADMDMNGHGPDDGGLNLNEDVMRNVLESPKNENINDFIGNKTKERELIEDHSNSSEILDHNPTALEGPNSTVLPIQTNGSNEVEPTRTPSTVIPNATAAANTEETEPEVV